ncbi:outer membrane beta-barrel protein [Nitratireductor sp. CAU 1489]|uniref:Outer membrane beta-barrel protein n=2 Tax=Nitratireductor arenosus TaxID=2682096 RepID=A0A844QJ46_9HYPH|nr:outer membrane beta-barrel protein [Nitratireductor arenosus]
MVYGSLGSLSMRKAFSCLFLLATVGAASAADLDIIEAPEINPERFGWTGAYVGASVGYSWMNDVDRSFVPPFPDHGEDWVVGAHAGYLHQFGSVVVGAEVEYTNLDIRFERAPFKIYANDAVAAKLRAGYAMDRLLVSAHGGAVYATTNIRLQDWGWTLGANVDYALTNNILLGLQYTHFDFEEFDNTLIDARLDTVTARIGYKF